MEKRRRTSLITKIILATILMLILAFVYRSFINYEEELSEQERIAAEKLELFKDVDKNLVADLTQYTIYGKHLNMNINLPAEVVSDINLNRMKLVLKSNESVLEYNLTYSLDKEANMYNLRLSKENYINEGVDLNHIPEGEYYMLVEASGKIHEEDEEQTYRYYSVENKSKYGDIEFYTTTKPIDRSNRKVNVFFGDYVTDTFALKEAKVVSQNTVLPEEVYDICLDAGHGGRDNGASWNSKDEADYTLKITLALKDKLEELGYKVKLTRSEDLYTDSYGEKGRSVIPNSSHSKLSFSIHLNSTDGEHEYGGVEVYAPYKADLRFAKNIADNIVKYAGVGYSINSYARVQDGVYVRTYNPQEIVEAIEYAHELEYTPYESLSTETNYLFMIRETGGIMTRAYIDGRNKHYGDNPYYNSNVTTEGYLLELGFINCKKDMEAIDGNMSAYIDALVDSITRYL